MSLSFWYKTLPNNVCSWIKFIRPKQGYLEDLRVLEDAGCEVVPTERNLKFCSYTVSMKVFNTLLYYTSVVEISSN